MERSAPASSSPVNARPDAEGDRSWPEERLTPMERKTLRLAATGARDREIAALRQVGLCTVKSQLREAYRKLGARNRVDALNRAKDLLAQEPDPATE